MCRVSRPPLAAEFVYIVPLSFVRPFHSAAVSLLRTTGGFKLFKLMLLAMLALSAQQANAQLPTTTGWTALPTSTSLEGSGACPPDNFGGDPFLFSELCQNVIRTWNGAIADTIANRLIIWGGGHGNYYGNEIYSLNLTANPITLTRLKDPTVPTNYSNAQNCIDAIPPSSPNAPNSREDYGGLAFIPGPYQMYITGGSLACQLGNQSQNTWTISLNNLSNSTSWVHANPMPPLPGNNGGFTYGNVADYDPNSGLVFLSDSAAIYSFDFQTGNYKLVSALERFVTSIYLSGAIDPVRKLFVLVGGCASTTSCGPGDGVFVADISNPTTTTQQNWTAATIADPICAEYLSGGASSLSSANPGFTYDSVANDFVGWPNFGNSVYIMTPDVVNRRLRCQKLTFPNGPPNSSHANHTPNTSYGTFGRFRYFPALDIFVLVNDWNIPAYVLRLRNTADFTLSATPNTAKINPGGSAAYTVSAKALNGFTGMVDLSVSGVPSGAAASFNPTSIPAGASSTLTVTTTGSTPIINSTLTITGTSASLMHSAPVNLDVQDFTVSTTPNTASTNPGGSTAYTVSAKALNGFTGMVNLSVSGLPTGATASFNPTSVTTSGNSTLTVQTASNTPVGSWTLTITSTSGSLTHSATTTLVVNAQPRPDFTIATTPSTQTVIQGASTSYTVNQGALNGFSGNVSFSVSGLPTGATGSFNPTSVTGSGSSTLTVQTTSNTPVGSWTLTITGTSGSLTHSATTTLVVSTMTVAPPVITSATTASGTVGSAFSYQITATNMPTSYGATGLPAGLSVSSGTGLISGTPTSAGTSTVTLSASNGGGTGTATLTVTIAAGASVSFVQAVANATSGTSESLSLSFPVNTVAGDLLLVAFDFDTNTTASSVSDSQGNVFTAVGNQLTSPGGARSVVYYANNIKGGADTVTVNLSGNSSWIELYLTEYSGVNQTSPIDVQAGATGIAGSVSSGNATTTASGDMIYGYCVGDWICAADSGFAARSIFHNNLIEDKRAGNPGIYAATGSANNGWTMQMVTIKHR